MAIRNPKQGRSAFSEAFADARKRGVSTFTFEGKRYSTKRADRPDEKLTVKDYGDESARMAGRTPKPDRTKSYVDAKRRDARAAASPQVKKRSSFDPREVEEGLEAVRPEEFLGGAGKIAATGLGLLGAGAAARAGMKRLAAKKAEREAVQGVTRNNRDLLYQEARRLRGEQRATARKEQLADRERQATQREVERMEAEGGRAFRKGGAVKKAQKSAAKPAAPRKPVRRRRP